MLTRSKAPKQPVDPGLGRIDNGASTIHRTQKAPASPPRQAVAENRRKRQFQPGGFCVTISMGPRRVR